MDTPPSSLPKRMRFIPGRDFSDLPSSVRRQLRWPGVQVTQEPSSSRSAFAARASPVRHATQAHTPPRGNGPHGQSPATTARRCVVVAPKRVAIPDEWWQLTGAQGKRPAIRTRAERPARHKSCVLSPLSTHRPSLERLPDQPMTGRWQARPHWCVTALRCHGGLTPGCCQADTRRLARTPSMGTLTDRPCSSSRVPSAVRNEDRVKYQ